MAVGLLLNIHGSFLSANFIAGYPWRLELYIPLCDQKQTFGFGWMSAALAEELAFVEGSERHLHSVSCRVTHER